MVRVILNKIDNLNDQLEIKINLIDSPTAKKWKALLIKSLEQNVPIKKHVSMHGWIMDQSRTLKHIVDEVHYRVKQINNYNFAKRAWELKRKTITKDFNIDLDLSIDKLIENKTFNFDLVNQLHDKFVQLEGAKTLDNLVSVSPYFDLATPDIRWHISKINNLAHELFHWGEEYARWNRLGYYNPEMHVHYYNSEHKAEYSEEDNETFTRRWNHGQVHIGDTTVGKTYWDAFNDRDDHIHNDELEVPKFMTADFHMYFGNTSSQEEDRDDMDAFNKWCYDRQIDESVKQRIGKPVIGHIDCKASFGTLIQEQINNICNGYNNIHAIIVDDKKSTYEWTIRNEEIDIEQHA